MLVRSGVARVGEGNGDKVRGGGVDVGVGGKVEIRDGVRVCVASLAGVGSKVGDIVRVGAADNDAGVPR